MAFVMGRSCSYGVHLRTCLPSPTSSSISSHSLVSFSRFFFLRFSSSCRTRRLKLCAAPSSSLCSPPLLIHNEAEQASGSSPRTASRLRQLPAMKQASSLETEVEAGKDIHVPLVEEAVAVTSRKRATKRKKALDELPLQHTSDNGVATNEVVATSKKTSTRKKTDTNVEAGKDIPVVSVEEASAVALTSRKRATKRKKAVGELPLQQTSDNAVAANEVAATSKKTSTRKKSDTEVEAGKDIHVSSVEEALTVPVTSRKRATKSKKAVDELSLQQNSDNGVATNEVAATSKKTSTRKKPDVPILGSSVTDTPGAEERCLAKSPQRKKRSTSADVGGKGELSSCKLEGRVELTVSVNLASSSTSSLPLGTPKKSTRKKKALTSVLPVGGELIDSVNGATQDKKASKEKSSDAIDKDGVTIDTPVRKAIKKVSSSLLPVEEKGTLNVFSTLSQDVKVESTLEPYVPQEVRKVENSVDTSSLTDEMPVISFADAHTNRRRQSETWSFQNDFNRKSAANVQQDLAKLSVATTKASPQTSSLWEDALNSFKGSAKQHTTEDQSKQSVFTSSDKVAPTRHNGTESKKTYHKKEGFTSHTSRMGTLRDASSVQKPMARGRAPTRAEGIHRSNAIPTISERRESNSQHWTRWSKSNTHGVAETAVQRHETSYTKQFAMTDQRETRLQQGYVLANIDRARGWERKKRKEFSVRNVVANQSSTISYMQIFGTGFDTGDTVPTVLLFFDRRRFLFNVGEGLHRFCMQHKFKLSKIDHVFLTRVCSETVGGLPGLILTLADMSETGLTVKTWGPSSLDDLAQAMRVFLPSGWMEHTHTFGPEANDHALSKSSSSPPVLLLEDELIKISAVLLFSEDTVHTNFESSADQKNGCMLSTVYICELSTVRGKFDPDKARAKGLRPGHKYGKLQKGEPVLSDDGTTMVHPEDVLGPSSPGPIMFVVDCPSTSYVSSLTSSTSLQSFFSETGKVVNCMIHIGPMSVTRSKDYQSWMDNFKETHHIMAQPEVKVLGMPTLTSCARTLWKLNLVCPWLFPVVEIDAKKEKEVASGRMVAGENLLKYRLRPLSDLGLDSSEVPEAFDHAAPQEKWDKLSPGVLKARDMACQVWKRWSEEKCAKSSCKDGGNRNCQSLPTCLHQVSREEMELVFLGTGSSQPSKHRNVTGIYIHLFKKGGVLLDCGEGTFAQLKRRYGAKGADDVLLGLKCIWISHMHADHFTGILRILSARRELLQAQSTCEPILVIGPRRLKFFLDPYGKIEDLGMEFLDCSQTTLEVQRWADGENAEDRVTLQKDGLINGSARGASGRSGMQHIWKQPGYHIQQGIDATGRKRLRTMLDLLGLKELYSVPVIHCPNAFAVVLEAQERKISENATKPGWKLVFSGDTRPCQALVEAAHEATILIHEATFEDDLIAEAVKKNHSITHEAIKVGVDAGVYRIFLTHFSQRYPTIPYFDNRFNDRACMAFDMMSVNLADLPIVPELLPALQTLFKDQSDAEEEAEEAHVLSV